MSRQIEALCTSSIGTPSTGGEEFILRDRPEQSKHEDDSTWYGSGLSGDYRDLVQDVRLIFRLSEV